MGPVLHLEVMIKGVPMQAVVDCGAQSSIISGNLSNCICNHMEANGRGHPKQGQPTVMVNCVYRLAVKAPMFASENQWLLGLMER